MLEEFFDMLQTGKEPDGITSLEHSIHSHLVAFAAEKSRQAGGSAVELENA